MNFCSAQEGGGGRAGRGCRKLVCSLDGLDTVGKALGKAPGHCAWPGEALGSGHSEHAPGLSPPGRRVTHVPLCRRLRLTTKPLQPLGQASILLSGLRKATSPVCNSEGAKITPGCRAPPLWRSPLHHGCGPRVRPPKKRMIIPQGSVFLLCLDLGATPSSPQDLTLGSAQGSLLIVLKGLMWYKSSTFLATPTNPSARRRVLEGCGRAPAWRPAAGLSQTPHRLFPWLCRRTWGAPRTT